MQLGIRFYKGLDKHRGRGSREACGRPPGQTLARRGADVFFGGESRRVRRCRKELLCRG